MLTIVLIFLAPVIARASLYALSKAPLSWRDADWSSTKSNAGGFPILRS